MSTPTYSTLEFQSKCTVPAISIPTINFPIETTKPTTPIGNAPKAPKADSLSSFCFTDIHGNIVKN